MQVMMMKLTMEIWDGEDGKIFMHVKVRDENGNRVDKSEQEKSTAVRYGQSAANAIMKLCEPAQEPFFCLPGGKTRKAG